LTSTEMTEKKRTLVRARLVSDRLSAKAGSGLKCKMVPSTILHFRDQVLLCCSIN
jgi:hypothetical protein